MQELYPGEAPPHGPLKQRIERFQNVLARRVGSWSDIRERFL